MLSETKGLKSRHFHGYRSVTCKTSTPCPTLQAKGKCPQYSFEEHLRRNVMNSKLQSLHKQAADLLALEHDVSAAEATSASSEWRPSAEDIAAVVEGMKKERAFLDWSLDQEVMREMFRLKRISCPYSHSAIGSSTMLTAAHDGIDADEGAQRSASPLERCDDQSLTAVEELRRGHCPQSWIDIFKRLTIFQKVVTLLLLRGSVVVTQGSVVDDMEDWVRRRKQRRRQEPGGESSDPDDDEVSVTEEEVDAAAARRVRLMIVDDTRGVLQLSYLPKLVSAVVRNPHAALSAPSSSSSSSAPSEPQAIDMRAQWILDLVSSASSRLGRNDDHRSTISWEALRKALSLSGIPKSVTDKECDLSVPTRCNELFELLDVFVNIWQPLIQRADRGVQTTRPQKHQMFGVCGVKPLRMLSLRGCAITSADTLVSLLRHHTLHKHLIGMDLSFNKFDSLRFLFQLKADYGDRLLFLGLQGNPITRKPNYREQVRATLPRLVRLDGESIRRPPLALPFPTASVPTSSSISPQDCAEVLATVRRFFYAWETQQVPLPPKRVVKRRLDSSAQEVRRSSSTSSRGVDPTTSKKRRADVSAQQGDTPTLSTDENVSPPHRCKEDDIEGDIIFVDAWRSLLDEPHVFDPSAEDGVTDGSTATDDVVGDNDDMMTSQRPPEEELDEETFAKRYLHPDAHFSISALGGCRWFDEEIMKVSSEADMMGTAFEGIRLSGQDHKELMVMDVSIRNHSRNLTIGKPALHRVAIGSLNCFSAYQSTLYPQRMSVSHQVDGCSVHVTMLGSEDDSKIPQSVPKPAATLATAAAKPRPVTRDPYAARPTKVIVGKHGRTMEICGPQPAPQVAHDAVFQLKSNQPDSNPSSSTKRLPRTFVVTMHGKMSWRAPTMQGAEDIVAFYDRTLTLVHRVVPRGLRASERARLPNLVVVNDMVTLRPAGEGAATTPLYNPRSDERLQRLAVEYGLDSDDGMTLVKRVAERCSSEAAMHKVLWQLVFGEEAEAEGAPTRSGSTVTPQGSMQSMSVGSQSLQSRTDEVHAMRTVTLGSLSNAEKQQQRLRHALLDVPAVLQQREATEIHVPAAIEKDELLFAMEEDMDDCEQKLASGAAAPETSVRFPPSRKVSLAALDKMILDAM